MKNIENNEAIKNDAIQKITWLKFNEIVETKEPRGLFYTEEGDQYIGLNNTTGEAFAKDFNTLEECTQWLQRKINLDIQWIIDEQMDKCRDVLLNKNAEYGMVRTPVPYQVKATIIKGHRATMKGGTYIAPSNSKNAGAPNIPFQRTPGHKFPVEAIHTLSVPQMIGNEEHPSKASETINNMISEKLEKRFNDHIKRTMK